jgi:uncharacterized protein
VIRAVLRWPGLALIAILVALIRVYQRLVSPFLGPLCRFQPSCSHYMVAALRKYGLVRGLAKGAWRVLRCHPWNPGGYDPP